MTYRRFAYTRCVFRVEGESRQIKTRNEVVMKVFEKMFDGMCEMFPGSFDIDLSDFGDGE